MQFLVSNHEELCKEEVKTIITVDFFQRLKCPYSGLQYKSYLAESEPVRPTQRIKEWLGEVTKAPPGAVLEV